jgi:hypothetical protein
MSWEDFEQVAMYDAYNPHISECVIIWITRGDAYDPHISYQSKSNSKSLVKLLLKPYLNSLGVKM